MIRVDEKQRIGFKHVRDWDALVNFHFNSTSLPLPLVNYQGKKALGATVAFLIHDKSIVDFTVAVCSGAEEKFNKYNGKKKALEKLLWQNDGDIDRAQRTAIWQKFFETFGKPS